MALRDGATTECPFRWARQFSRTTGGQCARGVFNSMSRLRSFVVAMVPQLLVGVSCVVADELPSSQADSAVAADVRTATTTGPRQVFRPDLSDEAVLGLKSGHPLAPILKVASECYQRAQSEVRDYACILVRRERVDGHLGELQYIDLKLRHEQVVRGEVLVPFSVYMKFLGPVDVAGREALYVHGQNNGQIRARRGGRRFSYLTAWVSPDSEVLSKENRYPITDIGIKHLSRRLVQLAREELGRDSCSVEYADDSKVDERECRCIQVVRPMPGQEQILQSARIFVDKQLGLPIHFESYETRVGDPSSVRLMEQYTYRRIRLNVGFTDADFDYLNPAYRLK
jgi:hypothetical protein